MNSTKLKNESTKSMNSTKLKSESILSDCKAIELKAGAKGMIDFNDCLKNFI